MDAKNKDTRVIDTLTGPWEKRNLPKIAAALPQWVSPTKLTVLGLITGAFIMAGYILTWNSILWLWLVNFGLFLHWFADSLDGTLARVRHIERPRYGYFVDHISDVIFLLMLCIGIGLSPLMNFTVALSFALVYFLMNIYVHINVHVRNVFQLSYGLLGPTELRIVLFLVNLIVLFWNPVIITLGNIKLTFLDIAFLSFSIILLFVFFSKALKGSIELYYEDPEPKKK